MDDPETLDRFRDFLADEEAQPRRVGRYELGREIGRGGMAVVYEARDTELGRKVALKLLHVGAGERVRREAMAAARLQHPNVVTVHELGENFIALEHVEGKTLAEALPTLSQAEALRAIETVAEAAGYAHVQGVVHRDIKPSNVLIDNAGRVVLADFGLAKLEGEPQLTRSRAAIGTPDFMAPEQVRGELARIGPPTDVWSIGVMLHLALTGERPFAGETEAAIYDRILREEPRALPGPLGAIVRHALEKEPEHRYPDGTALAVDLRRCRLGEAPSVRPLGPPARAWRWLSRRRVAAAVAVVIALGALGVTLLEQRRRLARQAALEAVRTQARLAVAAALELRRVGGQGGQFLAPLEAAYERVRAEAPELAEPDFLMGRMERALGRLDRALAFQKAALQREPTYRPARYERALLLSLAYLTSLEQTRGDADAQPPQRAAAAQAWRDVSTASIDAPGPRALAEGLIALLAGRDADARGHVQAALRADPLSDEAWRALVAIARQGWHGAYLKNLERIQRRIAAANTELQRYPDAPLLLLERARLEAQAVFFDVKRGLAPDDHLRRARSTLDQVIARDPASRHTATALSVHGGLWQLVAQHARATGQSPLSAWREAESHLERALRIGPSDAMVLHERATLRRERALFLSERGDPDAELAAAENDATRAILNDPRLQRAWFHRARLRAERAALRKGLEGEALFHLALADLSRLLAAEPRLANRWAIVAEALAARARHRAAQGLPAEADLAAAEEHGRQAIALDPNEETGWLALGAIDDARARQTTDPATARALLGAAATHLLQAVATSPQLATPLSPRIRKALARAAGLQTIQPLSRAVAP